MRSFVVGLSIVGLMIPGCATDHERRLRDLERHKHQAMDLFNLRAEDEALKSALKEHEIILQRHKALLDALCAAGSAPVDPKLQELCAAVQSADPSPSFKSFVDKMAE